MNLSHDLLEKARAIMARPTTFGTVAAGLCMQITGEEDSIHWDPAVLDQELSHLLGDGNVHPDVLQRLNAAAAAMSSDSFFRDPSVFHAVCATLLDPDQDPSAGRTPPSPEEMAWTCTEIAALLGRDYRQELFSPDVARYCGVCLVHAGLHFPPQALAFADFPDRNYPDPERYADETLLNGWLASQEAAAKEVDATVAALGGVYVKQLLELRAFGGSEKAFQSLADRSAGASAAPR